MLITVQTALIDAINLRIDKSDAEPVLMIFDSSISVRTVSYTHLDVYKRQEEMCSGTALRSSPWIVVMMMMMIAYPTWLLAFLYPCQSRALFITDSDNQRPQVFVLTTLIFI